MRLQTARAIVASFALVAVFTGCRGGSTTRPRATRALAPPASAVATAQPAPPVGGTIDGQRILLASRPVSPETIALAKRLGDVPEDVRGQAERIVGPLPSAFPGKPRPLEARTEYVSGPHRFQVIDRTGRIWMYQFGGRQRPTSKDLGTEGVLRIAEVQLARTYGPQRLRKMYATVLEGPHDGVYTVRFREMLGDVLTHNLVSMDYFTDGRLMSIMLWDEDVSVDLKPRITRAEAERKTGGPAGWIATSVLEVVSTPARQGQHLAWRVWVRDPSSPDDHVYGVVDARTGKVLESAQAISARSLPTPAP